MEKELINIGGNQYKPEDLSEDALKMIDEMNFIYSKSMELQGQIQINNLAVEFIREKIEPLLVGVDSTPIEQE